MTASVGYAIVTTTAQDLNAQLSELIATGVDKGRMRPSGATVTDRPGLSALLAYARKGATVVVTAIDRLGGSVSHRARTITDVCEQRIVPRTLRLGVEASASTGRGVAAIVATLLNSKSNWAGTACCVTRVSPHSAGVTHQAGETDCGAARATPPARCCR